MLIRHRHQPQCPSTSIVVELHRFLRLQLESELAGVLAAEEASEHAREDLDIALHGVLDAAQAPLVDPAGELGDRSW